MCLMFPKAPAKKKRKKHAKSILQPAGEKRCFLCMELYGDYQEKEVEEHHIIPGTANRAKSEELGLKCNLCLEHHRNSPEAVHTNAANALILKQKAQEAYEQTHSRREWMKEIGKNYL